MMDSIGTTFTSIISQLRDLIDTKVDKKTTVNGHILTSNINLNKYDLGLDLIDNTSDINKPVSIPIQNFINQLLSNKVQNTLHINGYQLTNDIQLTKSDIGLSNINNTSDINKPISNAVQQQLNIIFNNKVDKITTINNYPLSSNINLNKNDIGLDQVNNTSDLIKPISIPTQNAIDSINSSINTISSSINNFNSLLYLSVPIGVVMMFMNSSPPDKYMICDGSSLLITDYQDLFDIIGSTYTNIPSSTNFNLPDMRGLFVRGLDSSRGIDPGRILSNSIQSDSTKLPSNPFNTNSDGLHTHTMSTDGNHQHDITFNTSVQSGTSTQCLSIPNYNGQTTISTNNSGSHSHTIDANGSHSHIIINGGDSETRPVNIAVNYIIKVRI